MLRTCCKLAIGISVAAALAAVMFFVLYLKILPDLCRSSQIHKKINTCLHKHTGISYIIRNPVLKTSISPEISFMADDFKLIKNNEDIVVLKNINTKFFISGLIFKKLKIKTLGADYIYADINKITELIPKQTKSSKSGFDIDLFDSLLYVKKMRILFCADNAVSYDINARDMQINNEQKRCKYVHFNIFAKVKNKTDSINISIADENKVFIKKHRLYINNCRLKINQSIININANAGKHKKNEFRISSVGFAVENAVDILKSGIIIPNASILLSNFKDVNGLLDFSLCIKDKKISGDVNLHKLYLIFTPVNNLPVNLEKGYITVSDKEISLTGFCGYYGTAKVNGLKFGGVIKDYMKTFAVDIIADAIVTNDFSKFYLSEMIGYPVGIIGKADTKLMIKSLKGVTDLTWLFKIDPECTLLVGGEPLGKYKLERVLVSKMQIQGSKLHINGMDYFVTVPGIAKFTQRRILSLNGIIDFKKGIDFKEMGFDITEPMPSEFLNMVIRRGFFRKGNVTGKLKAVSGDKGVKLFGNLALDKITVPSQRLFIEKGSLQTDFNTINISTSGKYRRSAYNLTGSFENNIAFPIIINDIELSIDGIDIERMLHSFNHQGGGTKPAQSMSDDSDTPAFDLSDLIIKKCTFKLANASYKQIDCANLRADMVLDDKTRLILNSNKFDFAGGHSSCHIYCDLKNHIYRVMLGVKDVDSDIIASSLLGLDKEISGKASGIIDLHTDKSLKLNGNIKFLIENGSIGQVGLIEYILKIASVFRNPLAMVSPGTIFDLMNIPDGNFEKIQGSLDIKNNVVEHIKIKSYADQLSAYIAGRFDIENKDASLRIYTRLSNKHKGIFGFLRNISLSSIASRVPIGAKNEANYYSSELSELPEINADNSDCQIFLTKIDGDVEHNNFLSSLKKLK